MKWYKFWVKAGVSFHEVDYVVFSDEDTIEYVKCACEEWVDEKMYQQAYDNCEYDFEKIERPPKEWLENIILKHEKSLKYIEEKISFYGKLLNSYQLKDKVDKIIDNIN